MARDAAKAIMVKTVEEESDPLRKHWANLFIIEMEQLDNTDNEIKGDMTELKTETIAKYDKLEKRLDEIDDKLGTTDKEHSILIKELQVRVGLIGAGSGGVVSLVIQYFLGNH